MAANNSQNSGGQGKSSRVWKIVLIIVLAVLIISPIDLIPGDTATVVGMIDDVGYAVGIIGTIVNMVRRKREPEDTTVYNDVDSNEKR